VSDEGTLRAEEAAESDDGADAATGNWWASDRWTRYLPYAVWGAFFLRVAAVLWVSRSWFFTNDDWDYITRQGWRSVLDPHADHLNVVAGTWAYVVRGIVGLDYWPGYALLAAIAWPLVGLAAWYVWRRLNVDPRWAALGAIYLMWLGTAAWIQFGHAGQGVAAAATIVAIYLDGKPLRTRYLVPNIVLSLLAVSASSTAGLAVIVRAGLSLVYRKWNGVVAAGSAAVVYLLARFTLASFGPDTTGAGLKELTDVVTTVRVGLEIIGVGMREVIPAPRSLAWLLGLLLIIAAVLVLRAGRFSYFTTALVGSGAVYAVSALITRFLGSSDKLDLALSGEWGNGGITAPRFANLILTYLVVAMIPLVASKRFRSKAITWGIAGIMVLSLGFTVTRSFSIWGDIAAKSAHPKASWPAQLVMMRASGEPSYPEDARKIHPSLSNSFDIDAIDYLLDAGLADSLLASDIYRLGDVKELEEDLVRGKLRINVQRILRPYGDWGNLGRGIKTKCIRVEGSKKFRVDEDARFQLERVDGEAVTLRWVDEWGRGTVVVSEKRWNAGDGIVNVEVAGPLPGAKPGRLFVESAAVNMCVK